MCVVFRGATTRRAAAARCKEEERLAQEREEEKRWVKQGFVVKPKSPVSLSPNP